MKHLLYLTLTAVFLATACKDDSKNKPDPVAPRDKSITPVNSFSELFVDSNVVEHYISLQAMNDSLANRVRSFYNTRNYSYAWFFKDGMAPYTNTFRHMQDEYIAYSRDSALYNPKLWQIVDSLSNKPTPFKFDSTILQSELQLTSQFFRYANRAYQGRFGADVKDLGWYIPRKRVDPAMVLDSLISNKDSAAHYEPVNRMYNLLKVYLQKYSAIEKSGGWSVITDSNKTEVIRAVKKRLQLIDDYDKSDSSATLTDSLQKAIKNFQRRYGLAATGTINKPFLAALNVPVEERIKQLLINMERIRWVPVTPPSEYLLVNIPEFRLHVYENNDLAWSMNVVVGSTAHNTVIFSGNLQYVVFSPYWNVPANIYKNEVLPGIKKNPNYLAAHNMEKTANGVRQKPGTSNALGLVKFLFPNSYDIYLHDTPSKNLFREDARAASHGCIRLAEPKKLAEWLLRNDPSWDSTSITKAMTAGKERYVNLKKVVPVYIGYFTTWVDREGKLNFRNDIYGHDKKMATHLFVP